jgi:hypothetical protein
MLMAIPALVSAAPIDEIPVQVEESVEAVDANATVVADGVVEENTADEAELNYEDFQ